MARLAIMAGLAWLDGWMTWLRMEGRQLAAGSGSGILWTGEGGFSSW